MNTRPSSRDENELADLFARANGLPAGDRARFLDKECAGRPDLRLELESLLTVTDSDVPAFMKDPGAAFDRVVAAVVGTTAFEESKGERIGPYTLVKQIGEGGCGTVFLANQTEPVRRQVALKIIKVGMDTKAVVARFEQERQALAVMNHPNVAKVFDAGVTPLGRPYFVMEHVPGEAITVYADRHNLSVRQRLELFIPVCEAVQHAHSKSLIHRDLKPANILVAPGDSKAVPKVIDFGIAKATNHALTDNSFMTEPGVFVGTPEYMSPEQAEMGATDIDTRTDVYSLGVVLYELLSGMLPFDKEALRAAGFDGVRKILREKDTPKPSERLSKVDDATGGHTTADGIARHRAMEREHLILDLRRELDWIPLKAMRKDRTQRYGTPTDLARDIQHYLDGQPLEARPESASYRTRKFVRRNRGAVIAITAVFAALVLGLAGTIWQARVAANQRDVAEAEKELAKSALNFVNEDFAGTLVQYGRFGSGQTVTVREALDLMEGALGNKAHPPYIEASLRMHLGVVYHAIGVPLQAEKNLRQAIGLCGSEQGDTHQISVLARKHLGLVYCELGKYNDALPLLESASTEAKQMFGQDDREAIRSALVLASCYDGLTRDQEAEALFKDALERSRRVLGSGDGTSADCENDYATFLLMRSRFDEAEGLLLYAIEHTPTTVQSGSLTDIIMTKANLAALYADSGRLEAAEKVNLNLLDGELKTLPLNHPIRLNVLCNLAGSYSSQHRYGDAERTLSDVLPILRSSLGETHNLTLLTRSELAGLYAETGRAEESVPMAKAAYADATAARSVRLYEILANYGNCLLQNRQFSEAEAALLEAHRNLVDQQRQGVPEVIDMIIKLYEAKGEVEKATQWRSRLAEISKVPTGANTE